jgi:hypothetical protein
VFNSRLDHEDFEQRLPPSLQEQYRRERRMFEALRALPLSRRPTSVEVRCKCPRRHLLASLHPVAGDPDLAAWWIHGGDREPVETLSTVGDILGVAVDLLATLRLADGEPTRIRHGHMLSIRSLPLLAQGRSYLGSVSAECLPRTLLNAGRLGPILAVQHRAWLTGDGGAPALVRVSPRAPLRLA